MTATEKLMCPRCARELGPKDITSANGFACCTRCQGVFLLPKDLAWAPHELAYESDRVKRPRGVLVSRVGESPHDAYRKSAAMTLPIEAMLITWRPPRTRWLLALLVPFACVISGFFAAIRPPTSPPLVITAACVPLVIAAAVSVYWLTRHRKALPSIEIRSEAGAAPRLVVRGEEKVDVEAGEVQSIEVERFEAPLEIYYRGVRVGPRTIGKYAVVARVAGRAVRLATFDWPQRAMFVAAELRSALGLDSAATRQRVAVVQAAEEEDAASTHESDEAAETEAQGEAELVADEPRLRRRPAVDGIRGDQR